MLTMAMHSFEEKGYSNFVKTYVDYENTFFWRIGLCQFYKNER
jgi:hypothetical protein